MKFLAVSLVLFGCTPLDSWNPPCNPPKVGYVDTVSGCPRWAHAVRGPDAYDVAHGRPYHCEVPMHDPDFADLDPVDQ